MAPVINYLTAESIAERRAELLSRTTMTLEELRRREATYMLDGNEHAILRGLEDLDFLESGDNPAE